MQIIYVYCQQKQIQSAVLCNWVTAHYEIILRKCIWMHLFASSKFNSSKNQYNFISGTFKILFLISVSFKWSFSHPQIFVSIYDFLCAFICASLIQDGVVCVCDSDPLWTKLQNHREHDEIAALLLIFNKYILTWGLQPPPFLHKTILLTWIMKKQWKDKQMFRPRLFQRDLGEFSSSLYDRVYDDYGIKTIWK